jgi:hypothetical protein
LKIDAEFILTKPVEIVNPTELILVQDERTHYVLMGTKQCIETFFFDDQQTSYLNSSSVVPTVAASDLNLAVVNMTNRKSTDAIQANRNSKREV